MNQQKYRVCVTAIIKNEGFYIEEWLCYHRSLGVDHFFIYDNNSEDGIDRILKPYINHGIVTLMHWPLLGGQIDAYNHAIHLFGHSTEWMAYIDLDEFIVIKEPLSLPEFLAGLEGADQLLIPWRNFDFSGHEKRPSGLVIENYTQAQDIPAGGFPSIHAKSIVRPPAVKRVTAHNSATNTQATVDGLNRRVPESHALKQPNYDRIQINHYYTKSFEEYAAKLARGQGDNGAEKGKIAFNHPGFTTQDTSALRYVDATRRQLELMRSLPESPFRYGSQMAPGGSLRWDPFNWIAKVAVSNYLANTPSLRLSIPIEFDSLGKGSDNIAVKADEFGRSPEPGAFRQSIHVKDVIRRLGNDVVCDLVAEPNSKIAISGDAVLSRDTSVALLKSATNGAKLTISTERLDKSRCFAVGFALRAPGALRVQLAPSSLRDNDRQIPAREVELPSAGYYCGIVELNKQPLRAAGLDVAFSNATAGIEIFDLFAVAYG